MFTGLLASIFLSAVGIGVAMGWGERPGLEVAAADVIPSTSTTAAPRPTTTRAPASTTTTTASTTTTVAPTTTTAPRSTPTSVAIPTTTTPPTTQAQVTVPTTTPVPPTTALSYNPILCAEINQYYADDPGRPFLSQAAGCPVYYW